MVDPIKGPGEKIIINTKPRTKEVAKKPKDGNFDKVLNEKNVSDPSAASAKNVARSKAETNLSILQQQNIARMQKFEAIAKAVRDGTYKLVDSNVLAQRLLEVMVDKKTREKFIKKFLNEETENAKTKGRPLSDLELKKLIYLVKGAKDEEFDDPELEEILKELV